MKRDKSIRARKLICDRCGYENDPSSEKCNKCNSHRFAPRWVAKKCPINQQVSVEITTSDPRYGPVQNRITLAKWWPGGSSSFHVPNVEQWNRIQKIVNEELGPILGWKGIEYRMERYMRSTARDKDFVKIARQMADERPEFLAKLLDSIDTKKLGKEDLERLSTILIQLGEILSQGSTDFREAFMAVLDSLPNQEQKALERLNALLQTWSLQQITAVALTVRSRLDTIKLFKKQILDQRTHEIKGDNSIHRILEKAMWMIDEHYWLLKSNETLRKLIGNEMSKIDKKRFGKKRPDFVCGSVGERLVLVELKRPSKKLTIEDLNQLETYLTIAERYTSDYRYYSAFLVGNKKDSDLMRRLKHRSPNFKVLTYSDLVTKTEERYQKYLE